MLESPVGGNILASVTVRKIADGVKERLRVRAARHGRSLEEELRRILTRAANESVPASGNREIDVAPDNVADAIARIVDPIGGIELDLPPRGRNREPPRFDE